MKIQGLISGLVLMCAIVILAKENKTGLKGKIQDESGFGIISGSLEIYSKNENCKLVSTITTSENGTFTLANLADGEYEIVANAKGFDQKIETLKVNQTSYELGTITLKEDDIALEEAVIYGKTPQKVIVLDEAVIYGKAK